MLWAQVHQAYSNQWLIVEAFVSTIMARC